MPQNGIVHGKFNTIIFTCWIIIITIPNVILTSVVTNQHEEDVKSNKFDLIDVSKHQQPDKNGAHTTRIFTNEDIDDNFWLKYFGEEFRNAVHLQVDDNNNVRPRKQWKTSIESINSNVENGEHQKRFVREPAKDKENKQIPVESSTHQYEMEYPTEAPEIFNDGNSTSTTIETSTSQQQEQQTLKTTTTHPDDNISEHKKILIHNKNTKPTDPLKTLHTPTFNNLQETQQNDYQINEVGTPVIVQIPPVIYYQRVDSYPKIDHHGYITNLYLDQHRHSYYTHPPIHETLQHHAHHYHQTHQKYPYQKLQHFGVPPTGTSLLTPPSTPASRAAIETNLV